MIWSSNNLAEALLHTLKGLWFVYVQCPIALVFAGSSATTLRNSVLEETSSFSPPSIWIVAAITSYDCSSNNDFLWPWGSSEGLTKTSTRQGLGTMVFCCVNKSILTWFNACKAWSAVVCCEIVMAFLFGKKQCNPWQPMCVSNADEYRWTESKHWVLVVCCWLTASRTSEE